MKHQSTTEGDVTTITLSGDMTEDVTAALTAIRGSKLAKQVVFDCERVDRMNSIGVGRWVQFLEQIGRGRSLAFEHCPPSFVDYANILPNFFCSGEVRSIFAPFTCGGRCGRAALVLLETKGLTSAGLAPQLCGKCEGQLSVDVDAEDYLGFLTRLSPQ
jgi:ABC-type transporter Mla MlaB component